ncbi:MAG: glycosyltransferase family 4 protein [bacterium]|nr:glycosyltransferase family 4 protein [bacterium]
MARVMLIGYSPLPSPALPVLAAPSLRTRQFLKPILDAGHTVNLYTLPLPGSEGPEGEVSAMVPDKYEGLSFQRFTNHSGEFAIRMLTEQARQLGPDAIVGVNTYPAYVGARLAATIPLWADLNGYWMAEMQGQCAADGDDSRLETAWAIERSIVRRLDKYSAVSRPQLHAVLGEMAGVGRLNRHTVQYQFGHHIPNAAYAWPSAAGDNEPPLLRGPIVPADAFVVLWSGGFNVWSDIQTLVTMMNSLMERYPTVHFVSTGGRINGVDTATYQKFEDLVEASPYKDRFHRLGWIKVENLPRVYREADIGINVDTPTYETMFGARNRLNSMAAAGLAIVTTVGTELSEWLDDGKAAITAPIGDPEALAQALEPWIEQREQLQVYGRNARRLMERDFSLEKTTRPLLAWLQAPQLAPDNQAKLKLGRGGTLADLNSVTLNSLEEEAVLLERHRPKALLQAAEQLDALRTRPLRRIMLGIKKTD